MYKGTDAREYGVFRELQVHIGIAWEWTKV